MSKILTVWAHEAPDMQLKATILFTYQVVVSIIIRRW